MTVSAMRRFFYLYKPAVPGEFLKKLIANFTAGIAITFTNGSTSYTTFATTATGHFLIRGLRPGVYTATVYTANAQTSFNNIAVTEAHVTDMGVLHIP